MAISVLFSAKCGIKILLSQYHGPKCIITLLTRRVTSSASSPVLQGLPAMAEKCPTLELQDKWYKHWEANRYFFRGKHKLEKKVECSSGLELQAESFCVMLPPPNVTGSLHLGHALTVALQDTLVRWQGMLGADVLWVPGCDHAGIATQVMVERHLQSKLGLTRHQLGKEQFLDEVWSWKNTKEELIYQQLRKLGAALDWPNAVFTMDERMSTAVTQAFVTLFERGLIYRRPRPVHYCPALQSVISDVEVEPLRLSGPTEVPVPGHASLVTFGVLYDVTYPVVEGGGRQLVVSTTRPETIPADTAVMVHPQDDRYRDLVGRRVHHPLLPHCTLPVIADESVDPALGTGAVKVTPGMSAVDYTVGQRHDLPDIDCLNPDGTMGEIMPALKGLPRFTARTTILSELRSAGLLLDTRPHPMVLPRCSRTGDILETRVLPQWFVRVGPLAARALEAVECGALQLEPESQRRVWRTWMANTQHDDWCISRQLWWGHRVPVYRVKTQGGETPSEGATDEVWVAAVTREEALQKATAQLDVPASSITLHQDQDVLDTWFSSALFPFAALGWPRDTPALLRHFPTSLLVTGQDILFFWVARMVWLGTELTGQLPFKRVQLHGLVCDGRGVKMSKTRGNAVDPLRLIGGAAQDSSSGRDQPCVGDGREEQWPVVGADVLRMSLLSLNTNSDLVSFDRSCVEHFRTLPNKMWQSVRFVRRACETANCTHLPALADLGPLPPMPRWLLHHTHLLTERAHSSLSACFPSDLISAFTSFWRSVMCDVYLESVKPLLYCRLSASSPSPLVPALSVLVHCMHTALRCIAPVMPHLSEELHHCLPLLDGQCRLPSVFQEQYPDHQQLFKWRCPALSCEMEAWLRAVSAFRSLRVACGTGTMGTVVSTCPHLTAPGTCMELSEVTRHLAGLESVTLLTGTDPPPRPRSTLFTPLGSDTVVHLHVQGNVDVEAQITRLQVRTQKLLKQSKRLRKLRKSPEEVQCIADEVQQTELIITSLKELR